jgi:hypothetical protein
LFKSTGTGTEATGVGAASALTAVGVAMVDMVAGMVSAGT